MRDLQDFVTGTAIAVFLLLLALVCILAFKLIQTRPQSKRLVIDMVKLRKQEIIVNYDREPVFIGVLDHYTLSRTDREDYIDIRIRQKPVYAVGIEIVEPDVAYANPEFTGFKFREH